MICFRSQQDQETTEQLTIQSKEVTLVKYAHGLQKLVVEAMFLALVKTGNDDGNLKEKTKWVDKHQILDGSISVPMVGK